ncbi:Uma2 family endonuclease [Nocardia vaccinii]|uniref:Uma2 family endonuclease n=1 Tax=Nocardia vaccinii TaxID=1822 RepID=UPI000832E08F|nr:Uma2 family endonuclease [Nocardia vaccinii]
MSVPSVEPDLPETMTWEELERLPEEIASQIELWNGHVVWARRGPGEHQIFTGRLWSGLERCARKDMSTQKEHCWRATFETNVFFGRTGKSDFMTPDFLVHRCLDAPYQDVRSGDVVLVGEVLSPSNTIADIQSKKVRYADGGIPWYWEVELAHEDSAINTVRAFALETRPGQLPEGVQALHQANYILVGEWTHAHENGVEINHPFPISIPWSELEF